MYNMLIYILVPVVAVFTKCEALELEAIRILEKEQKCSYGEAVRGAPEYAKKNLWNAHQELEKHKYPPHGHVYLQGQQLSGHCGMRTNWIIRDGKSKYRVQSTGGCHSQCA